jgi:hypothetical protein
MDMDAPPTSSNAAAAAEPAHEAEMDVDEGAKNNHQEHKEPVHEEKKEEPASMQADDEDAVEY